MDNRIHATPRQTQGPHRQKLAWAYRMQVFERDQFTCRGCDYQGKGLYKTVFLEVDHIVPLSAGGLSTRDNLQTLCSTCNAIKGVRMPNRMIRESARTSETLDQLSDGAERMFWRLTTVADDFGRFEADPRVLLSACFPLRAGRLKVEQIEKWLKELILVELVDTYRVEAKRYGVFKTWEKHQRTRAQYSKYPAPSSDNRCPPMTADDGDSRSSAAVVESREARVETTEGESRELVVADGFDEFWHAYPRKQGKEEARAAWRKLSPDRALRAVILSAVVAQRGTVDWTRDAGQFIPFPATWLNKKRWTDEVTNSRPGPVMSPGNEAAAKRFLERHGGSA